MDTTVPVSMISTNEALQCAGMSNWPRLTPTGKISHAKTRVYTQRYRKEWEQMPDFRGWLTSVPFQDTRAFCTYCNKNLHAHRLSLLKHTCTMKHQRAALMHQNEMMARQAAAAKIAKTGAATVEEEGDGKQANSDERESYREVEDDTEEYEYVVERLEMEEEELNDLNYKRDDHDDAGQNDEYDDEDGTVETEDSMDEDNPLATNKRIKIEREDERSSDALEKAMAHVHGHYLDGLTDDQDNVELEMVVTSEDVIDEAEHDNSPNISHEEESQNNDHDNGKDCDNDRQFLDEEEDSSDNVSASENLPSGCDREMSDSYEKLSSKIINSTLENSVPSSSGQSKTFKLSSGKTMTLRPGTQYVLSHVKGNNIPTIVMTDRKAGLQTGISPKSGQTANNASHKPNPNAVVPCTSQPSPSQSPIKIGTETKKPCISTHVMDTSKGLPVGGLQVSLYKLMDGRWTFLNESNTSPSGHCNDLVINSKYNFTAGRYKMHFDVDKYFTLRRIETMYPFIEIVFDVKNPTGNYHIPVLLSPFGYTTYRGTDR